MVRVISFLAVLAAVAALGGCVQQPKKGKVGAVSDVTAGRPLLAQYSDALARRANALFNDTIQTRASAAGDRAANRARNEDAAGDYKRVTGDGECDEDCAGHDAGFAYARGHKTENPVDCPNDRGQAFEEGCRVYGEHIEGARDDARSAVLNGKDPSD